MNAADRWALIGGWLAFALFVIGLIAVEVEGYPGSGASLSEYGAAYGNDTRKVIVGVNWLLTTVGGILLLWMLAAVHSNLTARSDGGTRTTLFLPLGLVFVLFLLVDGAVDGGYTGSAYFDAFTFNEQTAPIGIALNEVRFALEVQSAVVGAVAVVLGSVTLGRLGVAPTWFERGSYALGIVLLLIAIPLESLAVLVVVLWLVVASSMLLRSGSTASAARVPTAA